MSWNAWARRHRLARGIAVAVFMLIASAWLGVERCNQRRDPVVTEGRETGRLVATRAHPSGAPYGEVVIASGDTLGLMLGDPPPRVGDEVPLRYQEHRSGKRVYLFDRSAYLFDF